MGCPAGIGPEIIIKYFAVRNQLTSPAAVVIGDVEILAKTAEELNLQVPIHPYSPEANHEEGGIIVIQPPGKTSLDALIAIEEQFIRAKSLHRIARCDGQGRS